MNSKIKSIRIIPIVLLFLLFASNLYLGFITYPDASFVNYVIFSIIYLALGLLLTSNIKFSELIVFIATLVILIIYPVIIDFKNLHPSSSGLMSIINAIILIACFILLLLKIKD
jgi:hypothetical protein